MKASRGVLFEVLTQFVNEYGNAILSTWDDIYGLSEQEREELGNYKSYETSDLLSFCVDIATECENEKKIKRSAS